MVTEKLSTREILKRNKARPVPDGMKQLVVVLHNIRSMHNVGAVFRCADAFGIYKVILSGMTPAPPRPEITKTAIGAEEFVNWQALDTPETAIKKLKDKNYRILGIEQTKTSILLPDFSVPKNAKLCLVLGNEVTGIHEEMLPLIDMFVEIPQYGNKHSLNVSVAAGVALYGFLEKFWQFSNQ